MDLERLKQIGVRAAKKVYPRLGLRDSDILLASFPKSGNTWMRFIWANMVSLMELDGREIDFNFLNTRLVAEYDSHTYGDLEFDCLPRAVKTHRAYEARAFGGNRSIYIVRHPGDVAVSYFEYRGAQNKHETTKSALKDFLRNPTHGVPAWCQHVNSWRSRADVVVRYESLKEDAVKSVQRTLKELGIEHIRDDVVTEAVRRSSFDRLKRTEEREEKVLPEEFDSGYRFMRKGTVGEWNQRLSDDDKRYLDNILRKWSLSDLYNAKSKN
jgi:hypothetical protein